jgi:hypothetical protein
MNRLFIIILKEIFICPFFSVSDSGGTCVEIAPTPIKKTESSFALVGDKIYLRGGFTPNGIFNKVDAWEINSSTWSRIVSLPLGLHHTTASVVDGKLYDIGGFD